MAARRFLVVTAFDAWSPQMRENPADHTQVQEGEVVTIDFEVAGDLVRVQRNGQELESARDVVRPSVGTWPGMILATRTIIAEDPNREVWKHLRYFLDVSTTAEIIRAKHRIPKGNQKGNIQKQAEQLAYTIRQAEQYFEASSQVGLATRPVLLYYGAASLAQSLVLLKRDGTFSLDYRRTENKHNHHGLDLNRGLMETCPQAKTIEEFFRRVECACHVHTNGDPWGAFPLFYNTLMPGAVTILCGIQHVGKVGGLERNELGYAPDILPIDAIKGRALNAWDLLKVLPDLVISLIDSGGRPNLCAGKITRTITYREAEGALADVQYKDHFFIDNISSEQKALLLEFYHGVNPLIQVAADRDNNLYLTLTRSAPTEDELTSRPIYYPDLVEDLRGRVYYILQPTEYIPEPASFFAILFSFSMMARYYPDVWVRCLDRSVRIEEFINELLNVAYRKFPILILEQLTSLKQNIRS